MSERDDDLDRRFAELRRWDARHIPAFQTVLRVRNPRRSPAPLLAGVALGLAAVGTVVVFRLRARPKDQVTSVVTWRSPTASLLNPPGAQLLTTVPSVSESVIQMEEP